MVDAAVRSSGTGKGRLWNHILKSMGYGSQKEFEDSITVASDTPDGEFSGMDDYVFCWDYGNNIAYIHTTGDTFVQVGFAVVTKDTGAADNITGGAAVNLDTDVPSA
jgi:hypothetical protein